MQLSAQFNGKGSGTADAPYIIKTVAHLNEVRNDLSAHYKLNNDIDLSEFLAVDGDGYNNGLGWEPIGGKDQQFTGSF